MRAARAVPILMPTAAIEIPRRPWPELVKHFTSSLAFTELSESGKRNHLRVHRLMAEARLPLYPSANDLLRFEQGLRSVFADTTADMFFANVRRLFRWNKDAGLTGENVAAHLPKRKRSAAKRQAVMNIADVWPAIEACARDVFGEGSAMRERAFLAFFRYFGARRSEVCGLERKHVMRHEDGSWWVRIEQQRNPKGQKVTPNTKTEAGKRTVQARPELVPHIEALMFSPPAVVEYRRPRKVMEVSPFLFPFSHIHLHALFVRVRQVCPGFTPGNSTHVFRHSAAVELTLQYGATPMDVSRALGHASVEQCNTYLRGLVGQAVPWNFRGQAFPSMVHPQTAMRAAISQAGLPLGPLGVVPQKRGTSPPKEKPRSTAATADRGAASSRGVAVQRKQSNGRSTRSTAVRKANR